MFVGLSIGQASAAFLATSGVDTAAVQVLISVLLDMAADASASAGSPVDQLAVSKAIQTTLRVVLDATSAQDFVRVTLTMLQTQDVKVWNLLRLFSEHLILIWLVQLQVGALDLIAEKMSRISDAARTQLKDTMASVINAISSILSAKKTSLLPSAFAALTSLITSTVAGEESSLLETLPILLQYIRTRELHGSALKALRPLVYVALRREESCLTLSTGESWDHAPSPIFSPSYENACP
jgi:hypothetical protein